MNYKWILLEKYCELTGSKADTIRKEIRSGGTMFKFALKEGKFIYINYSK